VWAGGYGVPPNASNLRVFRLSTTERAGTEPGPYRLRMKIKTYKYPT
jgi:hypothetical protein